MQRLRASMCVRVCGLCKYVYDMVCNNKCATCLISRITLWTYMVMKLGHKQFFMRWREFNFSLLPCPVSRHKIGKTSSRIIQLQIEVSIIAHDIRRTANKEKTRKTHIHLTSCIFFKKKLKSLLLCLLKLCSSKSLRIANERFSIRFFSKNFISWLENTKKKWNEIKWAKDIQRSISMILIHSIQAQTIKWHEIAKKGRTEMPLNWIAWENENLIWLALSQPEPILFSLLIFQVIVVIDAAVAVAIALFVRSFCFQAKLSSSCLSIS